MSIRIDIPAYWQPLTDNQPTVEVKGSTVGECLNDLVAQFPDTARILFDRDGKLRGDLGIYINEEDTFPEILAKPIKDGNELHISYIIAGG